MFFISGLVALGIFHLIKKCYIITTQDSDIKLIEKNLEIFKSEEFKIKEFKDSPNEKAIKKELDKLKSVKKGLNTENIESIMLEIFKIAYKITSETEQANQPGIP